MIKHGEWVRAPIPSGKLALLTGAAIATMIRAVIVHVGLNWPTPVWRCTRRSGGPRVSAEDLPDYAHLGYSI